LAMIRSQPFPDEMVGRPLAPAWAGPSIGKWAAENQRRSEEYTRVARRMLDRLVCSPTGPEAGVGVHTSRVIDRSALQQVLSFLFFREASALEPSSPRMVPSRSKA